MREKHKILLVDDEVPFRSALRRLLEKNHMVIEADTGAKALELAQKEEPDLILLDIGLPDTSGLELLLRFKELRPSPTVVMITAYEQVRDVVMSIKRGAFDYLVKPVDLDEFELTIQKALEHSGLRNEVDRLRQEVQRLRGVDRLIGKDSLFLEAQMLAIKSAQSRDAGVLIQGESGVGKELFARLIHNKSPRATYPFVALNCAAFSREIIESELFGYEKGAFTGAKTEGKEGLLQVADGGTLFLDEVVDLHPEIQAKLLRVLEDGEFYPVGGTRKRQVDIRIVSACNQDLWEASDQGRFRKDLFFRLATILIELPSLRQRQEDIIPLSLFFMEEFNDKYGKHFRGLSPNAERILLQHPWPGNVRELRNTIERVILLENEETILGRHLHFLVEPEKDQVPSSSEQFHIELPEEGIGLEEIEKQIILNAYEKCQRNKSKAARFLKIPRHILIYRMKKHGIEI
ncbi:sigma-54-dependent transcriptional regulator [Desulforhabdus amnigena]|jgi:DNA-binding NtrC family response regulator|uniref:Acetoacetate metabolism regulatory protein AtoC n=1 Tax=Desulforhabdus amnigena TaxID=40218 RepID=A0A9W6L8K6_9BACT|nr:sigma-54 dependent transcriptional regulator [Desulforhabdus amnigena]NLJ27033.1 sigma-54-dependent Fis family transcriptional regulator [Deltaproteobacteria bacterium]GLI35787.1 acetoacetate metabolism regulatory protein AtoC [Desulforhabdus amnigena]